MAFVAGLFGGGGAAAGGAVATSGAAGGATGAATLGGINAAGAATGTLFRPATLQQFQSANFGAGEAAGGLGGGLVNNIISGGFSAMNAMGSVISGAAERKRAFSEARGLEFSAKATELEGRRTVLNQIIELNQGLGGAMASRGAAGSLRGSTLDALSSFEERAQSSTNIITYGAAIEATQKRHEARLAKKRGKYAFMKGIVTGLAEIALPGLGGKIAKPFTDFAGKTKGY